MDIAPLANEIFDALQEFDRTSAPYGLYAAGDLAGEEPQRGRKGFTQTQAENWKMRRDYPEWNGALQPLFEAMNFVPCESQNPWSNSPLPDFQLPEGGNLRLVLKRVSKIKVRQYGSKYHLDNQENFGERWEKLRMDKAIADLWSASSGDTDVRLLLFIGFDKAQRPFERELNELKPHQTRASHSIEFFERTWDDSIGRGFKVKAALWAHRLRTV